MEDEELPSWYDEDGTYNGDDPKCDEEWATQIRENWKKPKER